ncbi:uncharacterized protein LOC126733927 isoform X5 [Anthonomus grandis grandis]|uniref:uncharacterized protein LOC126733927 isoform X5 n=1 Tax=Anthonomus grandis grandis TaxID=2921223 RepID=UPI00216588D2|nr:uncharacterized protein LOC126733927 isoform X5 [Anthonomus grandis grandis]
MLKFCSPYGRRREFMVNPGGKAAQRGLREGDLISSINGESTRTLSNNDAHNLLRKSGSTLKLGLNEDAEASPKKRQYRTVQHQEVHQETVKKSTVSYTLKETIERSSSRAPKINEFESIKISESYDGNETQQNGRDVTVITNIPVTPRSTPSTSTASTPSTLVPEGKNISSSDQALASRQSSHTNCSSIPDEGPHRENENNEDLQQNEEMNNEPSDKMSKSKKRRERRKKTRNRNLTEVAPEPEKPPEEVIREPAHDKLEFLRLKRIEHKYKVESPKELTTLENTKKTKKRIVKSKSLDDEDFLKIQELSEASETEEYPGHNVIISEASSEENLLEDVEDRPHVSQQEEEALRTFLSGLNLVNSPEESAKDLYERTSGLKDPKAKRLQKRKELEEYFRPIAENPRYLDAISEEASDLSDKEAPAVKNHLKQGTPEQDLLKVRAEEIFIEKPLLVEAKELEEDLCSTANISSEQAEVVYLNDSSESSRSSGDFTETSEGLHDNGKPLCPSSTVIEENSFFSQLTPPPTPDGILNGTNKKSPSFDYTRIPNILTGKEPEGKNLHNGNLDEPLEEVSQVDAAPKVKEILMKPISNEYHHLQSTKNGIEDTKGHILKSGYGSNKTDSQKLLEFDNIIKLNKTVPVENLQILTCSETITNLENLKINLTKSDISCDKVDNECIIGDVIRDKELTKINGTLEEVLGNDENGGKTVVEQAKEISANHKISEEDAAAETIVSVKLERNQETGNSYKSLEGYDKILRTCVDVENSHEDSSKSKANKVKSNGLVNGCVGKAEEESVRIIPLEESLENVCKGESEELQSVSQNSKIINETRTSSIKKEAKNCQQDAERVIAEEVVSAKIENGFKRTKRTAAITSKEKSSASKKCIPILIGDSSLKKDSGTPKAPKDMKIEKTGSLGVEKEENSCNKTNNKRIKSIDTIKVENGDTSGTKSVSKQKKSLIIPIFLESSQKCTKYEKVLPPIERIIPVTIENSQGSKNSCKPPNSLRILEETLQINGKTKENILERDSKAKSERIVSFKVEKNDTKDPKCGAAAISVKERLIPVTIKQCQNFDKSREIEKNFKILDNMNEKIQEKPLKVEKKMMSSERIIPVERNTDEKIKKKSVEAVRVIPVTMEDFREHGKLNEEPLKSSKVLKGSVGEKQEEPSLIGEKRRETSESKKMDTKKIVLIDTGTNTDGNNGRFHSFARKTDRSSPEIGKIIPVTIEDFHEDKRPFTESSKSCKAPELPVTVKKQEEPSLMTEKRKDISSTNEINTERVVPINIETNSNRNNENLVIASAEKVDRGAQGISRIIPVIIEGSQNGTRLPEKPSKSSKAPEDFVRVKNQSSLIGENRKEILSSKKIVTDKNKLITIEKPSAGRVTIVPISIESSQNHLGHPEEPLGDPKDPKGQQEPIERKRKETLSDNKRIIPIKVEAPNATKNFKHIEVQDSETTMEITEKFIEESRKCRLMTEQLREILKRVDNTKNKTDPSIQDKVNHSEYSSRLNEPASIVKNISRVSKSEQVSRVPPSLQKPEINPIETNQNSLDNIKRILAQNKELEESENKPAVPPRPQPPVPPPRRFRPLKGLSPTREIPESVDMRYSNVVSPPRPASASTDSSESSRCTAKYNPDITSIEVMSLRDLAFATLTSLPWGTRVLEELSKRFTNLLPFNGLNNCGDVLAAEEEEVTMARPERRFQEDTVSSPHRLLTIIKEEEPEGGLTEFEEIKLDQRLKARNLSEWLVLARDKSKSTSSLDRTNIPINNLCRNISGAVSENENVRASNARRRLSLPQEIYEKQLIEIMEKEREIQRELELLEEEKRKLRAELAPSKQKLDDFYVSKRGDFAEMREKDGIRERPMSMPVFPTEFFRQQMYEEYMDKFCEREERKQHKVFKISSSSDLLEQEKRTKEIFHPIEIEQEFMDRVKQKLKSDDVGECTDVEVREASFGEKVEEEPVIVLDGGRVKGVETLPRHLQEFVGDLATQRQLDESIWSPTNQQTRRPQSPTKQYQSSQNQSADPVSPVWTPKSANSSPTVERKEFRPVTFQSPVPSRKVRTRSETVATPESTVSEPPWKLLTEGRSATDLSSMVDKRLPTSQSTPGSLFAGSPSLPRAQNPTVTLLQKAREGQLPKGAQYLEQDRKLPNDRPPIKYPGEVLYNIKNEYTSESESEKPKKMADLTPRKFEGVGPVTKDGMPLILRSEVKEKDQSKWYKRMYDTIHKQKPHRDEYITIKYKQKRAQYPYTSGYLSEPEPGAYDSDFTEYKYQTLDRRRKPQMQSYVNTTSTMPRTIPESRSYSSCDIVRNTSDKYINTPGRIENYRPGHSSISEKEAKQWWDEVMDIFDGWLDENSAQPPMVTGVLSHLEQQSRAPPPHKPRSFINQALKDGYESDSTLVFKRKEENAVSQISPKEQREAYKVIQKGGDVPFQGLRKPAPERPKETDLVEFFPISPTLTKIRIHKSIIPPKEFVIPERQYFCYPVNSQKTFANFKRPTTTVQLTATPPPSPPKRKSSRNNSTLRLISTMKVKSERSPLCKRHETCFTSGASSNVKRGEGAKVSVVKKIAASPDFKSKIISTLTTVKDPKSSLKKVHSTTKITSDKLYKSGSKKSSTESLVSRTPTPVKTFGTEKKKFDLKTKPKSGELLSPTEVKKGIKSISDLQYKESLAPLSSSSEGKSLPIKVGMTEKGRQILKSSIKKASNLSPKSKQSSTKPTVEEKKHKPKKPLTKSEICQQKEAIDSSHFFRNLFLRNLPHSASLSLPKTSWIVEKTNQLTRRRTTSTTSIGAMKIYLKHTRPVKDSKFISLDAVRSRSVSPKSVTFSDNLPLERSTAKRSKSLPSKLVYSRTQRSPSPQNKLITSKHSILKPKTLEVVPRLFFSETSRPISPEIKRKPSSPLLPRSPSCRKIMQLRHQHLEELSRPLQAHPELKQSSTSLDSFRSDDYQVYLKDIDFGGEPNKRFKDLNHFYSDIEKVGKLERAFDSKPRKKCEEAIIDYDRWMEVRSREKAEHELKYLYCHLKEHEREKGFLFLPKDVDKYKWRRELDRGLRIKEKSVENIKEEFERLKESPLEVARRREIAYRKDTYKPLWRGNSVINLASILTEKRSQSEGRVKTAKQKLLDSEKLITHTIGSRIWSSLSMEQVNNLKKQLQDIYGDHVVEVPSKKPFVPQLTVRRNSDSFKHDLMSESEKKMISQTISKEVLERVSKKSQLGLPLVIGKEVLGAKATEGALLPPKPLVKTNALKLTSASETESGSTDESTKTVINLKDVQQKVEYFEKAKELEYVPTIYKPAEDSSSEEPPRDKKSPIPQSKSAQNLKEFFGESDLARYATLPLSATRKTPYTYTKKPTLRALDISPIRTISEANSLDSLMRSRSASPYREEALALSKTGEVHKLRRQFEVFEDFFGEKKFKRSRSENDLRSYGHVEDLRRKYEYPVYSGRGRSRVRRGGMVSPVWLRPEDRYMPHINIISKIASLYSFSKHKSDREASKSMEELAEILGCPVGEVEKMKEKFDKLRDQDDQISLMGRMYTSSPNLKELRDITPYLTANWIAHRYPRSEDNTRSLSSPDTSIASRDTALVRRDRVRSSSPLKQMGERSTRYTKEPDLPPPPPPPKSQGEVRSQDQESPRKYVENEVTIHYKTPVRTEIKEYVSEDELAHRQAEAMKKIYEEERKRKYLQVSKSLQELQDMKSRRHTDNFIPSQKSPIPLNRYDDFDDLATTPKLRTRSPEPRLVAKALYNFVGQTARELTFRKGDLIYVRRQVDKNWYEGELNAMVGLFPVNYVEIVPYEHTKSTSTRKAHEGQARAKYNFVAQTHLELSLAKGELVTITRKVDENWFEGKIGGRKGIFPVSYVDVLIDPSEAPPSSSKPVASPASHSLLLNGSAQGKESMGSHLYTPNIPNPVVAVRDNGYHHAKPVQLTGAGTYSTLPRPSAAHRSPMDQTLHIETQSEPIPYRALYKYTPQNDDELELLEGDTVYVLEKCDDGWYVGSSDRTGAFGTFPGNYVEKI